MSWPGCFVPRCGRSSMARSPDGAFYCRLHAPISRNVNPMQTPDTIAREREALFNRISELDQRQKLLDARPKEPTQEEAVVWFQKRFSATTNSDTYQYTALRAGNGRWYTSAQMSSRVYYSWADLLEFIYSDEAEDALPKIWVATEFTEVL